MHMHIGIRARQDRAGAGVEVVQVVIGSPFVVRSGERRPRTRVRTTALIDQALAPCSGESVAAVSQGLSLHRSR